MLQDNTEYEEIAVTTEQAQKAVAMRDALTRLENNADFKLIILEEYFKNEPVRLASLLARVDDIETLTEKSIIQQLTACSQVQNFLRYIHFTGEQAAALVEQGKEAMDAIEDEQNED